MIRIAAFLLAIAASSGAAAQLVGLHLAPSDPKLQPVHDTIVDLPVAGTRGALHGIARAINLKLHVPKLALIGKQCGTANAFYDPGKGAIVLCYEYIAAIGDRLIAPASETWNRQVLADAVAGLIMWVVYHELGHALIDRLQLPATGREEDVADQIATFLLLEHPNRISAVSGVVAWWGTDDGRHNYADEHGAAQQRMYDVACIAYGTDPAFGPLLDVLKMPDRRRQRCPSEAASLRRAVSSLLGPYLK